MVHEILIKLPEWKYESKLPEEKNIEVTGFKYLKNDLQKKVISKLNNLMKEVKK